MGQFWIGLGQTSRDDTGRVDLSPYPTSTGMPGANIRFVAPVALDVL
jgi:hypothetical protein